MVSSWKTEEIHFTNTRGIDIAQVSISLNFANHPSIPPKSSSLPVPIMLKGLYIIIMFLPSRLHKGLFLLVAHSFFSGQDSLIKMLIATL